MNDKEIIEKVLPFDYVEELKRSLQEGMLYDEDKEISLEYNEDVNPEVDFDELKEILEEIIEKALAEHVHSSGEKVCRHS